MIFEYTALDADGRIYQGRISARNRKDLLVQLDQQALTLLSQKPLRFPSLRPRLNRRARIDLCFQLEQLLSAGLPLLNSLEGLHSDAYNRLEKDLYAQLLNHIQQGHPLSQALRQHPEHFDSVFCALIAAGEKSGELPEILGRLAESLKWQDEMLAQTRKLLLYPSFVALTVGIVSLFLLLVLIPQLQTFLNTLQPSLPWHTRILFTFSELLRTHGLTLLCIGFSVLTVATLMLRYIPTWHCFAQSMPLRLPLIGPLIHKGLQGRLAALLALLYKAGIPVLEALQQLEKTSTYPPLIEALRDTHVAIRTGENLADACSHSTLFSPMFIRMLRLGEQTGSLDHSLQHLAYFYQRDVREAVGRLHSLIEPTLTLLLGLLLGWLVLAIIGPIYDIISRLQP